MAWAGLELARNHKEVPCGAWKMSWRIDLKVNGDHVGGGFSAPKFLGADDDEPGQFSGGRDEWEVQEPMLGEEEIAEFELG
mmetsp:Transcript_6606/g.13373  ORF Transcript_6606/g.13373 Transcript_6606/m.13373 type:complete len:81 (-) Transcript_6606:785-1027(-)